MEAQDVRHVGVVGCGLMGSGIVEVCARAGLHVTFVEGTDELAAAGRARLERSLEAATEDPDAKRRIFERLGAGTRPNVVLASNTSSIPIATLAAASGRPADVIGMHFFNPVPVMTLVELTPAAATSDRTLAFARAFGTEVLGKTCVRSGDEAGFIVNRLLIPYLFDAIRLYERGFATREDIDTAIHLGLAHPMGPLTLSDLIGLDTVLHIGEVLYEAFGEERYDAPNRLRTLVAEGKLGRKTGEGFYRYEG